MAKINEYLNIGDRQNLTIEQLIRIIEQMYLDIAINLNKKPDVYKRETDGQTDDIALNIGDININTLTNKVEELVAKPTPTTVTWITLS